MSRRKYKLLVIGAANRHIENFIDRVIDHTESIEVVSSGEMDLPKGIKVSYTSFSLKKIANFFKTPAVIKRRLIEFDPDVIHVHQINSVALFSVLANRKINKPIVLTAWGSDILLNPEKSFLLKRIVQFCLKRADGLTSDSVFMAKRMIELSGDPDLDVVVCNFGIEATNLEINKKKVFYSNRMHNPLYRIDQVINSFADFINSSKDKEWVLKIAGRGSETEKLIEQVKVLGITDNVQFVGFLSLNENNRNYAEASFFISIPESDATAMSLLEAMYYKCIPVLSDLPANREWVSDGETGLIVNNLNWKDLKRAAELDSSSLGEVNHERVLNDATFEVSTKRFTDLHYKLIVND